MKNVIGTPARGESFFPRKTEIEIILTHLENGNNLQIAAPRRIGKTSILFYLLDNKLSGYVYVYVDTEAINDENEFFKKLLKELLRVDEIRSSDRLKRLLEQGQKFLKRVKSISLSDPGIEFSEDNGQIDYKEDLLNFLLGIELETNAKLVILLDEFPQTIQNIVDRDQGDLKAAQRFLQSNREIRLHPDITSKVKFIITGSIGLNHTVAAINSSAFINDLASIEVGPLSDKEARQFLQALLRPRRLTISEENTDFLFQRIEWLIPFHVQLIVQEMITLARSNNVEEIDAGIVSNSFRAIVQARNNNHFEHYYSRLKKQFKGEEFKYAEEVLEALAQSGTLMRSAIFDLSVKYNLQNRWRHITEVLMYDGYINNIGDPAVYRFNSPIVRMWWQRFICKELL
ncbi:MAG: hypothetical protein WCF67_21000 [Chitinophagaceae bacterium]